MEVSCGDNRRADCPHNTVASQQPRPEPGPDVPAHRGSLLELAGLLRRPELLYARGIALLELILIDGTGPAYTDPSGEGLALQLQLAADALAG